MMLPLLLLFCGAGRALLNIPPIDGVDRNDLFNLVRREFDRRRLFVSIVDVVSSNSPSSTPAVLSNTVAIGLMPSEDPQYYGFVSRRIAEALRCVDATDAFFEQNGDEPEYVLTIGAHNSNITRDADHSGDSERALLRRIAAHAGMEETDNIVLADCWFMRAPEIMEISVAIGPGPRIRSGWIVERFPLGKFIHSPDVSTTYHTYQLPAYRTDYSYIDGGNGAIIDVSPSRERGIRVWTPTGQPAFARVKEIMEAIKANEAPTFTKFRETSFGLLVTTLAPGMVLSYTLDDQVYKERRSLEGHHYYVSCDYKLGHPPLHHVSLRAQFQNESVGVELFTLSADLNYYAAATAHCPARRPTISGKPQLLLLDDIEQSGSYVIPTGDEVVEKETSKELGTLTLNSFSEIWNIRKVDNFQPAIGELPADIEQNNKHVTDNELLAMLAVVAILAVTTVVCVVRSLTSRGDDRKSKDGHAELVDAATKCQEASQDSKESTGTRSTKKKSISFANIDGKKEGVVPETELRTRIDAMVAAGPDEEEEKEEGKEKVSQESAHSESVAIVVVDETVDEPKKQE